MKRSAFIAVPLALLFGWELSPGQEEWVPVCPGCHADKQDAIGDETYCCYECGTLFQKPGRLKEQK